MSSANSTVIIYCPPDSWVEVADRKGSIHKTNYTSLRYFQNDVSPELDDIPVNQVTKLQGQGLIYFDAPEGVSAWVYSEDGEYINFSPEG